MLDQRFVTARGKEIENNLTDMTFWSEGEYSEPTSHICIYSSLWYSALESVCDGFMNEKFFAGDWPTLFLKIFGNSSLYVL